MSTVQRVCIAASKRFLMDSHPRMPASNNMKTILVFKNINATCNNRAIQRSIDPHRFYKFFCQSRVYVWAKLLVDQTHCYIFAIQRQHTSAAAAAGSSSQRAAHKQQAAAAAAAGSRCSSSKQAAGSSSCRQQSSRQQEQQKQQTSRSRQQASRQ